MSTGHTLPCPACGGTVQRYATGAGRLVPPSYTDRGYWVSLVGRAAEVAQPAVIWTCNGCELCVLEPPSDAYASVLDCP